MNVLTEQAAAEAQIKALYQQMAALHEQVKAAQERLKELPTIGKVVRAPGIFKGDGTVIAVDGDVIEVKFATGWTRMKASSACVVHREVLQMQPRRKPWQNDSKRQRMVQPSSAIIHIPAAGGVQDLIAAEIVLRNRELVEHVQGVMGR